MGGRTTELADLYLLGLGFGPLHQLTIETFDVLRRCRRVLHISNQHRMLQKINADVVDLSPLYWTKQPLDMVYPRIIERIWNEVERGPGVASVTYGHPLFFDDVHTALLRRARRDDLSCVVLPAVSSIDVLSTDLGVDLGDGGLQVFDATGMVQDRLQPNPHMHALVLQIAEFGTDVTPDALPTDRRRFERLQRYLMRWYPAEHRVTLVLSDLGAGPWSYRCRLGKLAYHRRKIRQGCTMYVPPIR